MKNHLAKEDGIDKAIDWCKPTAVTKVYVEAFRDGYQAERAAPQHAKERFLAAGFEISDCVTTTQIGKKSTRWNIIARYTDQPTQARLQSIFEFTASLFDEIMIDDFWFTDCACTECDAARLAKKGDHRREDFAVPSERGTESAAADGRSSRLGSSLEINRGRKLVGGPLSIVRWAN